MTTSEAMTLAHACATMTTDELASVLAFLEETTVGAVMFSKFSDWLENKSAGSDFAGKLKTQADQLASLSQHQLCLNLYATFNRICGLLPRHYTAPKDFSDNCEEIIATSLGRVINCKELAALQFVNSICIDIMFKL
jgi:hypothetical protein